MKILAVEQAIETQAFACYPDSSLLRNNDDFFIPNFSSHITAWLGIYVHVHKIGKHILPQFISRYYNAYGIAINFVASDSEETLQQKGLSTDIARGFDHSFAISTNAISTAKQAIEQAEFTCKYNNVIDTYSGNEILQKFQTTFSSITEYYTIKIGDIFFMPLHKIPQKICIGDVFECHINSQHVLQCSVK